MKFQYVFHYFFFWDFERKYFIYVLSYIVSHGRHYLGIFIKCKKTKWSRTSQFFRCHTGANLDWADWGTFQDPVVAVQRAPTFNQPSDSCRLCLLEKWSKERHPQWKPRTVQELLTSEETLFKNLLYFCQFYVEYYLWLSSYYDW